MILEFRIYDLYEKELFNKSYLRVLSKNQQRDINIAIPPLLHIIAGFFREIKNKIFLIAGTNLHFYVESGNVYVIATSLSYQSPIFSPFIMKIVDLLKKTGNEIDVFDLNSNLFFNKKVDFFKTEVEKSIEEEYKDKLISEIAESSYKIHETLLDASKNKYLIMGAGAAGKTSIIAQFFENWSLKQILNIKPTVLNKINQFEDDHTKDSFIINDLAGQAMYRKKHLENNQNFANLRCLIFVIDVQNTKNSSVVQDYFIDIINKLNDLNQSPLITIFLHKFDPEERVKISTQLMFWIEWLESLLKKSEFKTLNINYHLSSIKDNTAKEAIARTLLFTLPQWFLGQTIRNKLIVKSANSLYPIFGRFQDTIYEVDQQELNNDIYESSYGFGIEIGKSLISDWIKYIKKDEDFLREYKNKIIESDVTIKSSIKKKKFEICFKCPLKEELKVNENICELTHGLFKGLGHSMGFPKIKLLQTQVRDKTDECIVEISY